MNNVFIKQISTQKKKVLYLIHKHNLYIYIYQIIYQHDGTYKNREELFTPYTTQYRSDSERKKMITAC